VRTHDCRRLFGSTAIGGQVGHEGALYPFGCPVLPQFLGHPPCLTDAAPSVPVFDVSSPADMDAEIPARLPSLGGCPFGLLGGLVGIEQSPSFEGEIGLVSLQGAKAPPAPFVDRIQILPRSESRVEREDLKEGIGREIRVQRFEKGRKAGHLVAPLRDSAHLETDLGGRGHQHRPQKTQFPTVPLPIGVVLARAFGMEISVQRLILAVHRDNVEGELSLHRQHAAAIEILDLTGGHARDFNRIDLRDKRAAWCRAIGEEPAVGSGPGNAP